MKKSFKLIGLLLVLSLALIGCSNEDKESDDRYKVVVTTTIIADVTREIAQDLVSVEALMGPGIDPHLYKASAGDVKKMSEADMVIYNGLHLEGKMGEVFENIQGKIIFAANENIDQTKLLEFDDSPEYKDPHVWFDLQIWKIATERIAEGLIELDSKNADTYKENLAAYLLKLDEMDQYIRDQTEQIAENQRILITAHDAFSYFGKQYGYKVRGLQGISTDAEAGTADVRKLADYIVENQVKAIFVESSVPRKNIEALQEAVKARGFDVAIGGELYSDSTGDVNTDAESFLGTVKANIDTIVGALK